MGFKRRRSYENTLRNKDYAAALRGVQRIGVGSPRDLNGATLLGTAAWFGHEAAVCWLLDEGEDVDRRDSDGKTPLLSALASIETNSPAACFAIARTLIERGARVDARDSDGRTVLHYAVTIDVAEQIPAMVLERGADVRASTTWGCTPFHKAAAALNLPVLKQLADAGADVLATDDDGQTALFYALSATNGRTWTRQDDGTLMWDGPPIIDWLLDRGLRLDTVLPATGRTVLMEACARRRAALVARCLEGHPGVVDARDERGRTALFFADAACARLLLDAGADPRAADADGRTAWDAIRPGSDLDRVFQTHGLPARPGTYDEFPDGRGRTKLMMACRDEDVDAATAFLGTDDVNARDSHGKTALYYVLDQTTYYGDRTRALFDLLVANEDIDVRIPSNVGTTPLHLVARMTLADRAIATALLRRGADPDARDRRGKTPLSVCKPYDHELRALLTSYRDANATGVAGD